MSLGVHFALGPGEEARLLAAVGDDVAVLGVVEQFEEEMFPDHCDTDKAWDAIHRCLTDGQLEYANGTLPLRAAVLGGRQLYGGDDYTVSYVPAGQVVEVADALGEVGRDWLRDRFTALADTSYDGPRDDDDFEYTWENLQDLREFFAEAARGGRAVVFTVDA